MAIAGLLIFVTWNVLKQERRDVSLYTKNTEAYLQILKPLMGNTEKKKKTRLINHQKSNL